MLVCNKNITEVEARRVEMVRPEKAGKVWKGIPNAELIDAFHTVTEDLGWKLGLGAFSISSTLQGLAGAWDVELPGMVNFKDQSYSLGFLHANDMSRSLKIVAGSRVFVCNNGCAFGEFVLKHKHTKHFDLIGEITGALHKYRELTTGAAEQVEYWKERSLKFRESDRILMRAGRAGIMGWSKIGAVDAEFHKPSFEYDRGNKTCWGLYNAFTHIVKGYNPMGQMDQMNQFRQLLPMADAA